MTPASSIDAQQFAVQGWLGSLSKMPWRYFAVPVIGCVFGLWYLGACFFDTYAFSIFIFMAVVSVVSTVMVASSDLVFMGVQYCQRRGVCKKLVVRRRYVFGVVNGLFLGVRMLCDNSHDASTQKIWSSLGDHNILTSYTTHSAVVFDEALRLFDKADSLSMQLYLLDHMFGLEDLFRGIAIGVLCIVVWDLAKAAIVYSIPPVEPTELLDAAVYGAH